MGHQMQMFRSFSLVNSLRGSAQRQHFAADKPRTLTTSPLQMAVNAQHQILYLLTKSQSFLYRSEECENCPE